MWLVVFPAVGRVLELREGGTEVRRYMRTENDMIPLGRAWGGAGSRTVQEDQVVKVEGTHPLRQSWSWKPILTQDLVSWMRSPVCLGESEAGRNTS